MELPVSNQTSNFGPKPHIKKGYYPAKLIDVKPFERDGTLVEGKYGNQIIMEFAIYKADENGKPVSPVQQEVEVEGQAKKMMDVTLGNFVYHIYKDQKSGEKRTAVTPNSAITKIFKALGWEFNADEPLKPKEFIGKWCEVNVDDYEKKVEGEDPIKMSTIKDIGKYEGPEITLEENKKADEKAEANKPQDVKKEVKHEEVAAKTEEAPADQKEKADEILAINDRMANLEKLHKEGALTKEGYDQGMEQLNKQLAELQK